MARAQAELISTVIIVSIAVTLALGLVYYLTPLLAQARAHQQVMARLGEIASGLTLTVTAYQNTSTGFNAVANVVNSNAGLVDLYMAVLALDDLGAPRNTSLTYKVYNMTSPVASLSGTTGWTELSSVTVPAGKVYVYVRDGYYNLGSIWRGGNVTLYRLGLFRNGGYGVFKIEAYGAEPGYTYVVAVFAVVNGEYYLVAETALPAS